MALSKVEIERYARQIILKELGGQGQQALKNAKVLIVGAGGLGGPASLYLAASGVGHLGLVDFDMVDISNLHRQIQFDTQDIGALKTEALAARIQALNPHIECVVHTQTLTPENAGPRVADYDLVLDGTDDFATRFAVNRACLAHKKPLISGALGRFDGQLGVFCASDDDPCYQCFVPEPPEGIESCAAVGIVGAMAGIIGAMMALEAVKLITHAGPVLAGKLLVFDGLGMQSRVIGLSKDPLCPACGKIARPS